ncbi:MAG TPA: helix-turn-helix transcriptional regulator [Streptosporangiaceae bacterium]|nr:helix-turn-helix transcriptional regulator [Streptosporangiaceae bacterium]
MAVDIPAIRELVERVCTRKDVLDACKRRDLGTVITVLCTHGITQGQLAALTGIPQGRLSEYKTRKRMATATSTFEAFADGLGMPPTARRALGLAPATADSGPLDLAGRRAADDAASLRDVRPLITTLSRASAIPVLSALRGIHRSYLEADRLMGSMCLTGPVQLQMPVVERACEVTRGSDRAEMLEFASRFMEFGGWLFQDAGDLACAMHWTDRALDYTLELGDPRSTAYTLMRKAMIATEAGNPAQGLGIANSALAYNDALTPRLRAVILRQRSYSHAVLGEVIASAKDSDEAIIHATAGMQQGEEDRAPYCSPNYVAMEAGASWLLLGHPRSAIPILEKGHSEWLDSSQMRDYALCVSRLAAAYAAAGELEQACAAAEEAMGLAQGLGSRRVAGQVDLVHRRLGRWRQDPAVANLRRSLKVLVDSFIPEREAS